MRAVYTASSDMSRRAASLSILTLAVLGSASAGAAQTLVGSSVVLDGLFNAYAPSVLGSRMWIGGWLTQADFPNDKLFRSDLGAGGTWSFPVPALERADAGINDASVVAPPAGGTNLYYTAIPKDCAPQPNCYLTANHTALATSANGGLTWSDHGDLIGPDNGLGECGAWAPSALAVDGAVWVYYHGGNPSFGRCRYPTGTVFRSRFDGTGAGQRIDTAVVAVPLPVVNVDVSRRPGDGLFVMVANSLDLTRIHRFTSPDGVTWTEGATLVDTGGAWVPTPHVTWTDATHWSLWFGMADSASDTFIHRVVRWDWVE